MNRDFEKALCLGSGIVFAFLFLFISVSNGFIMVVLYRNPLRCFRKPFSMFLVFITAVDLFIGTVVCSGEAVMRLLCAFGDGQIPQEGDVVTILGYFGINSSVLLATAMSVDRLIATVWPHFYRRKISPRNVVLFSYLCLFLDFCLTSICWSFNGCLPHNRCSFAHYIFFYHNHFSLLSDIFLFKKKRAGCVTTTNDVGQKLNSTRYPSNKKCTNGEKDCRNFFPHFTSTNYFFSPVFCCNSSLWEMQWLWQTKMVSRVQRIVHSVLICKFNYESLPDNFSYQRTETLLKNCTGISTTE